MLQLATDTNGVVVCWEEGTTTGLFDGGAFVYGRDTGGGAGNVYGRDTV